MYNIVFLFIKLKSYRVKIQFVPSLTRYAKNRHPLFLYSKIEKKKKKKSSLSTKTV